MAPKIYTKKGDTGQTTVPALGKVLKSDARVDAVGDLDELNAHIGLVATFVAFDPAGEDSSPTTDVQQILYDIQGHLLTIGAEVAVQPTFESKLPFDDWCLVLEGLIDGMTEELPPLKNFILPGGTTQAASIHIARTVCRRCERSLVKIGYPVVYINRLSDFLFTLARIINKCMGFEDVIWKR